MAHQALHYLGTYHFFDFCLLQSILRAHHRHFTLVSLHYLDVFVSFEFFFRRNLLNEPLLKGILLNEALK